MQSVAKLNVKRKYDGLPNKNAFYLYQLECAVAPSLEEDITLHTGTVEYDNGLLMAINFQENGELYQIHKKVSTLQEALKAANVTMKDEQGKPLKNFDSFVGTSIFACGPSTMIIAKPHENKWDNIEAKKEAATLLDKVKESFPSAIRKHILNPAARCPLKLVQE